VRVLHFEEVGIRVDAQGSLGGEQKGMSVLSSLHGVVDVAPRENMTPPRVDRGLLGKLLIASSARTWSPRLVTTRPSSFTCDERWTLRSSTTSFTSPIA